MGSTNFLEHDKISSLILKFSLPAITGMLVNASYNVVGRVFVGRAVGSLGISGISLTFPIVIIVLAFAMLVGIGAVALVSIKLGEKDQPGAELIAGNALTLSVAASFFLIAIFYFFMDPLLGLFGGSGSMLVYAKTYLHVMLWGIPFQLVAFAMNNIIRGQGDPKTAMYTMILGALLNIVFDSIFVMILHWGMVGAGLGAVLSQFCSAVWVVWYYYSGKSLIKLRPRNMALQAHVVKQIFTVGMASFVMQLTASVVSFLFNKTLMRYGGEVAVAAMGVIYSVGMMLLMPIFGLNQGVQPIIGYNYGAKRYDRVRETLKLGMLSATAICVFGFVVVMLFSNQIIGIFTTSDNQLISVGGKGLRYFITMLPIVGYQIIGSAYFQARKRPAASLLLTSTRQVGLLIPCLFILPPIFGLDGIWAAMPVSDGLSAVVAAFLLISEWKRLKHMQSERDSLSVNNNLTQEKNIIAAGETL